MNTIREQLDEEIAHQEGEVARLTEQAKTVLPRAQARLDALKKLSADLTPDFEDLAARLKDAALTVPVADRTPDPVKEAIVGTRDVQVSGTAPALSTPRRTPKKGKKR